MKQNSFHRNALSLTRLRRELPPGGSLTAYICTVKLPDKLQFILLYVLLNHIAQSGDTAPMVVASTASPYKFAADVCKSLGMEKPADDMDALDMLSSFSKTEISYPLRGLNDREVRFTRVIDANQMLDVVKEYVK